MAVEVSMPNTAARCSGSASQAMASSSWRSMRSRSRVAGSPRSSRIQGALTGPVPSALCLLTSRCRLAVCGQRARRWSSHSVSSRRVRSSSGRVRPAMVIRRFPRSASSSCRARIWPGRAAWMAASATHSRACGVVAAWTALVIWSAVSGCQTGSVRAPTLIRLARAGEDHAVAPGPGEQRPQRHQRGDPRIAAQPVEVGQHLLAGDLAQVVMAGDQASRAGRAAFR